MTLKTLRFALAVCTSFVASLASASVISFGPAQGFSDSPYNFGGSLTFSGSALTTWSLAATTSSSTVYTWTPGNSTFISSDGGATLTFSEGDGTYSQSKPSVHLHTYSNTSFAELTGTQDSLDWAFFVSWASGGQYANGNAYAIVASNGPAQVPQPASAVLLGLGLAGLGLARRRKLKA